MKKTAYFKKIFIDLFLFVLIAVAFLFSGHVETPVRAASTGGGDYMETESLKNVSLPYGVKYRSAKGTSRNSMNDKYVDQVVNYIEVPSIEGLLVTSWSCMEKDKWTMKRVNVIAADFEAKHPGYKVIAISNGDFYDINAKGAFPRTPTGALVSEGNFYKSIPTGWYYFVSFTNDGTKNSLKAYYGNNIGVNGKPTLAVYDGEGNIIASFPIDKVNEEPGEEETAVYYGTFDKEKNYQPVTTCIAGKTFMVGESGAEYCLPHSAHNFYGIGKITEIVSQKELSLGTFAICANNEKVNALLDKGVRIRVQYEWYGAAGEVQNGLNAGTRLLINGEAPSDVNTADGGRTNARHPRTAIGVKEDGTIVLLVNDGRQPSIGRNGSYGRELAAMMKTYGCVEAYNLDGGGSSILYYRDGDQLVLGNKYSDPSERSVSNTVVIAVKEPEIDARIEKVTSNSVSVAVDILNNNRHNMEDFHIRIGNKTAKTENGKATINGLKTLCEYKVSFYYVTPLGREVTIGAKLPFATSAGEYKIKSIEIKDEGETYSLELKFSDRKKATDLHAAHLYIGDKEIVLADGKATFNKADVTSFKEIRVEFNEKTITGSKQVVLINPHAPYLNDMEDCFGKINDMLQCFYK